MWDLIIEYFPCSYPEEDYDYNSRKMPKLLCYDPRTDFVEIGNSECDFFSLSKYMSNISVEIDSLQEEYSRLLFGHIRLLHPINYFNANAEMNFPKLPEELTNRLLAYIGEKIESLLLVYNEIKSSLQSYTVKLSVPLASYSGNHNDYYSTKFGQHIRYDEENPIKDWRKKSEKELDK